MMKNKIVLEKVAVTEIFAEKPTQRGKMALKRISEQSAEMQNKILRQAGYIK